MKRSILVAAGCSLAVPLASPLGAQTNKVIPAEYAASEGPSVSAYPLNYQQCRWQYLLDGAALCTKTAVLTAIAFRPDGGGTSTTFAAKTIKPTVVLYHTKSNPTTMSKTWAANIGTATGKTVFAGKTLSLPASSVQYPLPNPFKVSIPFSQAFVYARASGNFLVDWTEAQTYLYSKWTADGVSHWKAAGRVRVTKFWQDSACANAGGDSASLSVSSIQNATPGGSLAVKFTMSPGAGSTLTLMLNWMGISNRTSGGVALPLYLGALNMPKCAIASDNILAQAGATSPITWAIPNDPRAANFVVYTQGIALGTKGNLVPTKNAYQMLLSPTVPQPGVMQTVYRARDNTQATGFMGTIAFSGPILRFTGAFN